MVSPTISSSIKALPLSYADRAKKAQKIRPLPSAQPPQRITIQSPPKTSIRPNGLAATTLAQTVLAPVSNSIEDMAITTPIASSPLASSPLTNKTAQATSDLAVKALSVVAAHTSTQKSPIVNVWNVRKEQMAARSGVPSVVAHKAENGSVLKQPGSQLDAAVKLSTEVRPKSGSEPRRDIAGGPAVMRPSATTGNNDSSVILSPSHSLHVQPLSTESWPEVGKASSTVAEGSTSKESDDNINGSVEHSLPPVISPRKNEKTKWVPIPPEELRATADALLKGSRPRKGAHRSPSTQKGSRTPNINGSSSSQSHSRPYSNRNSASQSASQSRTQSRTNSIPSSPQQARGRRLPADDPLFLKHIGGSVNSSSGRSSPRHVQPPPSVPHPINSNQSASLNASNNHITPNYGHPNIVNNEPPLNHQQIRYPLSMPVNGHPHQNGTISQPPRVFPPYQMYPNIVPYDTMPSSTTPYYNWNGRSHPASGQQSPAYPHASALSSYPASVPTQHHFYGHSKNDYVALMPETAAVRVPPSEQSEAVAGFKGESSGGPSRPVLFGSIGIPGASQSPSPAPLHADDQNHSIQPGVPFVTVAIGIAPGEPSLARLRSRTRTTKSTEGEGDAEPIGNESTERNDATEAVRVIHASESETTKWEFGTTNVLHGDSPSVLSDQVHPASAQGAAASSLTHPNGSSNTIRHSAPAFVPAGLPLQPSASLVSTLGATLPEDEFEVKDFGFGFGPASGTGLAVMTRNERLQRQTEHERERTLLDMEKAQEKKQEAEIATEQDVPMINSRPRRGAPYNGGGYIHDRGVYNGRRGRGGYSRGSYRNQYRGGYSHASQSLNPYRTSTTPSFQPAVPSTTTPPNGYYLPPRQQLATYILSSGFETFPSPVVPPPSSQVNPPLPVPLSPLSFPLDSTRYYLLGQLEYYLSPQNMAQDFFLRQKMDQHGWIPISLIASFNRVRQLTMDMQLVTDVLTLSSMVQVRDDWVRMGGWENFVLPDAPPSRLQNGYSLAHIGNYHQNDPLASGKPEYVDEAVEQNDDATRKSNLPNEHEDANIEGDGDLEAEDDDEEEVVFVMGQEAGWSPEHVPHHVHSSD